MNDSYGGGEGEFGKELSATFRELIQNLSAQIAGNERTERVLHVLSLAVMAALALALVYAVAKLIAREHSYHSHQKHFEAIAETLEDEDLAGLAQSCFELGRRVDRHTGRRHNSAQVSQLTFAVASALGVAKRDAALYFCASMVYDAGFLDLPEELFQAEILSGKEKRLVRTHVQRSHTYFDFIPAAYYAEFSHVATYHHENMDGSGYPEGLKGNDIPLCARIIRVVESYVSLVNSRSFHKGLKPKAAVAALKRETNIYDMQVVDALGSLATLS